MSARSEKPHQMPLKVILLGDTGVGKTAIIHQYVNKSFDKAAQSTINTDFLTKNIIFGGRSVTMNIWDTAGQEHFNSLGKAFYRDAHCCIFVFDVSNEQSFDSVQDWYNAYDFNVSSSGAMHIPFAVFANKIDLTDCRTVEAPRAEAWCRSTGEHASMHYFETSAKVNGDVEAAFKALVKIMLDQHCNENETSEDPDTIVLRAEAVEDRAVKKNSCSC